MNKRLFFVILLVVGILLVGAASFIPRNMFLMAFVEQMAPGIIPASSYAHNLDSDNPDLVRESLAHLRNRKDPIAVKRAVELLQSTDDYIWLNATEYVGVCGRQEAVPYLIKALRHTAWRADNETAQSLLALTGQAFGTNYSQWHEWWLGQHPNSEIDWISHLGFSPRLQTVAKSGKSDQPEGAVNGNKPIPSEKN
jgi:hypothetical protein